jgi:hypothetical protein
MAFATCDRCRNAIVLGTDQAHQACCPSCKDPLRIATREEFLARLRQAVSKLPKRGAEDDGGQPTQQDSPQMFTKRATGT